MRAKVVICGSSVLLALVCGATGTARGEVTVHGSAGAAGPVGGPQSRELGVGAAGGVDAEIPVTGVVGFEVGAGVIALSDGKPPQDPRFADRSSGTAGLGMAGVRLHVPNKNVWVDARAGLAMGSSARFAVDGHLGWDAFRDAHGVWSAGPTVGYLQVVQPDDTLRPEDARVVWLGAHVALGAPRTAPPEPACGDMDNDGVCDLRDACPTTFGLPNVRSESHGCPEPDRDRDAIVDREDACPDEPGIMTSDPATRGCPPPPPLRADRDSDTVLDDEDACPDLRGERTADPKTNGCPPAHATVRVEGDRIVLDERIHFETNSPRVGRRSWHAIQSIAKFVNDTPDILAFDVEGHADRVGTDEYNKQLSEERAASVKRLLVRFGVAADRVVTHGYGRSRPRTAALGASLEDRRVEFWVTRSRSVPEPVAASK